MHRGKSQLLHEARRNSHRLELDNRPSEFDGAPVELAVERCRPLDPQVRLRFLIRRDQSFRDIRVIRSLAEDRGDDQEPEPSLKLLSRPIQASREESYRPTRWGARGGLSFLRERHVAL